MEAWYKSLKTPDANGVAKIGATDKVSVTGYSLGGHLATAFNQLRAEDGTTHHRHRQDLHLQRRRCGRSPKRQTTHRHHHNLQHPTHQRPHPHQHRHPTSQQDLRAQLNANSANTASIASTGIDRLVAEKQALQLATAGQQGNSADATGIALAEYDQLIEALKRIKQIAEDVPKTAAITNSTGKPADIAIANMSAASLDYQLAVIAAGKSTKPLAWA